MKEVRSTRRRKATGLPTRRAEAPPPAILPERFSGWFAARGWSPRPHQLALLANAAAGRSTLLIAPTGAGKTLAGFLPSLVSLAGRNPKTPRPDGVHTLYVSPLKALAVDIARNVERPVAEMGLPVRLETRTGDTPQHKRTRQRHDPPDMLLTTPEQVALLLASADAERMFSNLRVVIFDELHSLVTSKRGDLLSLDLARLRRHAPGLVTIGLSATVAEPDDLRAWLVPQMVSDEGASRVNDESAARAHTGDDQDSASPHRGEGSETWRAGRASIEDGEGGANAGGYGTPC